MIQNRLIYSKKSYYFSDKTRLILKGLLVIILILSAILGIKSYASSVYQKEVAKNEVQIKVFKYNLRENIKNSPKSSYELVVLGKKLLEKNQTEWAALFFEGASAKDPKYRDANLMTGYAYLRIAQSTNDYRLASDDYKKSIEFLLKARDLDPIYAETHELLAVAYKNIGNEKESEICYNKYNEFKTD